MCALLLGLAACDFKPSEQPADATRPHAATALDVTTDTSAVIRQYTGALVIGHEAEYFVDCASQATWWLDYEVVPQLPDDYQRVANAPYQEIYAQVEGYCTPRPEEGFASQYSHTLHIVRVLHLDHLDGGNDCTPQHQ